MAPRRRKRQTPEQNVKNLRHADATRLTEQRPQETTEAVARTYQPQGLPKTNVRNLTDTTKITGQTYRS